MRTCTEKDSSSILIVLLRSICSCAQSGLKAKVVMSFHTEVHLKSALIVLIRTAAVQSLV